MIYIYICICVSNIEMCKYSFTVRNIEFDQDGIYFSQAA